MKEGGYISSESHYHSREGELFVKSVFIYMEVMVLEVYLECYVFPP